MLLEAARKLIEQYGPAGFSLTEAARLAGVSPAAPYRHFRDRDALLAEVARSGFERFAARLDMAWNNGVPTPLSAFDNLGKAYLAFRPRRAGELHGDVRGGARLGPEGERSRPPSAPSMCCNRPPRRYAGRCPRMSVRRSSS